MKSNSKITIGILSAILIFWISFLFIEENKTITKSPTPTIIQTQTDDTDIKISAISTTKTNNPTNISKETISLEKTTQNIIKNNDNTNTTKTTNNTPQEINIQNTINPIIIPSKYDIQNMQFFSQAPYGNRNQPYQDACEEASLLIGYYYIKNINKAKDEYNKDLLKMVQLEMDMLGYFESTTIMEMKQIINTRDPSIKAKIIEHPSIRDIEKEISQDHAVIAPFYGKGINNPHYAGGGPEYHFMVIKGYDEENFITHDVGTMHGENWHYPKSLIMQHMHDRNRVDVQKGAPRILVLEK